MIMRGESAIELKMVDTEDIPLLTSQMAAAFDADWPADGAFDPDLLSCYHTGDFFERWPHGCLDAEAYKIQADEQSVGGVVVWRFPDYRDVLGLLFVAPPYQGYGIGARAWRLIEPRYRDTLNWLVAAPLWSPQTRRFYEERCGFRQTGIQGAYVILEKAMAASGLLQEPAPQSAAEEIIPFTD